MHSLFISGILIGAAFLPEPLCALTPATGKNRVAIRDQQQDIYFYPAADGSSHPHPKVLFAPGDLGMWGFAVSIAKIIASWGYDVYALDTRRYLESFTTPNRPLSAAEAASDFLAITRWMTSGANEKVFLIGWSEGAGLCILAAAAEQHTQNVAGIITLGMPETNTLAWHWLDLLPSIAGENVREPHFRSVDYLPKVTPVPLLMLQASHDEYITVEGAKKLFAAAQEPKRFQLIEARNHRFDGNQSDLFQAIHEGLQWTQRLSPQAQLSGMTRPFARGG